MTDLVLPYHDIRMKHWNPGATIPLIMPIHVITNVPDELIYENIKINSATDMGWQEMLDPHAGRAIVVGSGPSLASTIGELRQLLNEARDTPTVIFALNGAARYLCDAHDIIADFQVMIDARPETAQLVGPAVRHLLASQCHPDTFAAAFAMHGFAPREDIIERRLVSLYHLQVEGIDDYLPANWQDRSHCLIGGAASVGNTTGPLVFAMGFRDIHYFGMDSSNDGEATHAFAQPMNAGDPMCEVEFKGKIYTASLTMKLQAERFLLTAAALRQSNVVINVHGYGLLPDMMKAMDDAVTDIEKYKLAWSHDRYRTWSPGEECVGVFLRVVKPEPQSTVMDFGCGTGRAGLIMRQAGLQPYLFDFADNCRDPEAMELPFVEGDLRNDIILRSAYGFCTDVMEHIEPESVERVIENIMRAAARTFFQISTVPDQLGVALVGAPLHLTVKPHDWWKKTFTDLGYRVNWERENDNNSMFYVEAIQQRSD